MWILIAFAAAVLLMPMVTSQFSGILGDGDDLLDSSLATQRPVVHGKEVPASSLRVLYRWRSHVMRGSPGGIAEIDANWLCQTSDGLFVVALAIGDKDRLNAGFFSLPKLVIRWSWRSISEERARQLLAATPDVYRQVFGTAPGKPGRSAT